MSFTHVSSGETQNEFISQQNPFGGEFGEKFRPETTKIVSHKTTFIADNSASVFENKP